MQGGILSKQLLIILRIVVLNLRFIIHVIFMFLFFNLLGFLFFRYKNQNVAFKIIHKEKLQRRFARFAWFGWDRNFFLFLSFWLLKFFVEFTACMSGINHERGSILFKTNLASWQMWEWETNLPFLFWGWICFPLRMDAKQKNVMGFKRCFLCRM